MNTKGQLYPLYALMGFAVVILLWVLEFKDIISLQGKTLVDTYGLTGVVGLSFSSINLWLIIALIVAVIVVAYGGGGR